MRKLAFLTALIALNPDGQDGGAVAPEQQTTDELTGAKVEAGASDVDAQLRIELENARQQVRLLTKENQELRADNERMTAIVNSLPAKATGRLAELIAEKKLSGLPELDAIECAKRQIAKDEAEAKAKKR